MKDRIVGFLASIFNRMTITIAIILIEIGYFAVLIYRLNFWYAKWIGVGFQILSVCLVLYIVWTDMNPAYKLGWIILVMALQPFGAILYLTFGIKRPVRNLNNKITLTEKNHSDVFEQIYDQGKISDERARTTSEYVSKYGPYPAWDHTETKYYKVCDDMFPDMLEDLRKARHFIFMEYFIISEGSMWDDIFDVLKRKADEGVDVRIMYDDFGCIRHLPPNFRNDLSEHGISVIQFNPVLPIFSVVYNNRDHRKVCVIDGHTGYTGGFNLADEYINRIARFGHWKDTAVRMYGDGVWNLTFMFLNMWNALRPWDKSFKSFAPHVWHPKPFESDGVVQPFSDSPFDHENLGENVYLDIINQAKHYVYISTPYFIIDNEMRVALELAAKRGVDVRILVPGIPDKKLVYSLTRSYVDQSAQTGVKFYTYTPGFNHAKEFVCDDRIGVVGTVNMDYRSFYLHFECGVLMIGCSCLKNIKADLLDCFSRSEPVEAGKGRPFIDALFAAVLRVLGPIL